MSLADECRQAASGHGHGCACDACVQRCHADGGLDTSMLRRLLAGGAVFVIALLLRPWVPTLSTVLGDAAALVMGYDALLRAVSRTIRQKRVEPALIVCAAVLAAVGAGEGAYAAAAVLVYRTAEQVRGMIYIRAREDVDRLRADGCAAAGEVVASLADPRRKGGAAEAFAAKLSRTAAPVVLLAGFVIGVVSIFALHTTVGAGLRRAAIFWLIACPCALADAMPVITLAGLSGAARQGVLLRGGGVLDAAADVGAVVIEKKAALAGEGLRVVSIRCGQMQSDVFLRIAAHACALADDDFSEAIRAAYPGKIYIELVESFLHTPGQGVTVTVNGGGIVLGTLDFVRANGVEPGEDATEELSAYLGANGTYVGRVLFGSTVRDGAQEAVNAFGWEKGRFIAMVTDDRAAAAERFARTVGVARYYAECGPADRAALVGDIRRRQTKHGALLYVGDAETDAEAFREADLTAAPHSAAADGTADIIALDSFPLGASAALERARLVRTLTRRCEILVIAAKLCLLALAAFGLCPLWLAALAGGGVSLAAGASAARARRV